MKGGKDEWNKAMDPLFPRLHISDADKGGPKAPPRNKMAFCEQYNVASSQSSKFGSGSLPLLPLLPGNGCNSFLAQRSSSNVDDDKEKVVATSNTMPGSSHLMERSYAHCWDGVISNSVLTKYEPWMSRTRNDRSSPSPDDLRTKAKCNGHPSHSDSNTQIPGDETNFKAPPYFLQSGKVLTCGKLQLHPGNERGTSFSPVPSGELHNVFLKLPKITSVDQASEHSRKADEETGKLSQDSEVCYEKPCRVSLLGVNNLSDTSSTLNKSSELAMRELQPNQIKKISLGDEQTTRHVKSGNLETASRKRCASAMNDSSCSPPRHGDSNEWIKVNLSKECLKGKYGDMLRIGNADMKHGISGNSTGASEYDLDLTPDDVVSVVGHRLFWKARKTIVQHQRLFSFQIFELHRLVKVQSLLARSPELLNESHFHPKKQSIQFPQINKLRFLSPLDQLPAVAKTKPDAIKSDTDKECKSEGVNEMLPLPTSDTEKGHAAQKTTPKPLLPMLPPISADPKLGPTPMPISMPTDAKIAPWCFHPPPGSQWLVPVRSHSEGLIYKSYTGPCAPDAGLMTPVYGNCGPISLNTVGGMTYGVPLGHNYFQPYGMPSTNANGLSLEAEQMNSSSGFQLAGPDKNSSSNTGIPCETLCKVLSEQSVVLPDQGRKIDGQGSSPNSPPDNRDGETLSLFPTKPSCQVQNDGNQVQVIKVVPRSSNSAAESGLRIFQSIQKERKRA